MNIDYNKPIHVDLPLVPFPMKDIYRRLQMPQNEVEKHEGVAQLLDEALEISKPLIRPKGGYLFLEKISDSRDTVKFKDSSFEIQSPQVAKLLKSSAIAVIFMTTIGKDLENKAHELSQQGDVTIGFMLDAIASETADAVADYLHRQYIAGQVGEEYETTPRFSAGYGDWPITVQSDILQLCNGGKIGISVTESSLMIPRKSVSAVFGLK
ncbi:vitamin B12 dependent-methionine synthase activation domain-containing protein [bacterium]